MLWNVPIEITGYIQLTYHLQLVNGHDCRHSKTVDGCEILHQLISIDIENGGKTPIVQPGFRHHSLGGAGFCHHSKMLQRKGFFDMLS